MKKKWFILLLPILLLISGCQDNTGDETNDTQKTEDDQVVPGVEVFLDDHLDWVEDQRVGLVTNNTGIDRELNSTVDLLDEHSDVELTALYGPEHGVRGNVYAGDYIESYTDEQTGLPVYSLYGPTWEPTEEMLEDVDVLLFDIQDIGSNNYTYIYTLGFLMEAASKHDKSVIVLDRPNAIGGERVEGPLREDDSVTFMGRYLLPMRHGMTTGELALMWNQEYNLGVDLKVAQMDGWERDMHFEDTGLPWVLTSPNIPTPDSASLYISTGIFDRTPLSEGVGTTRPFEFVGAPWVDAEELETEMREKDLDGVNFRTQYYTPLFADYEDELIPGLQIHIEEASEIEVVELGLELATAMRDQDPESFEIDDDYNEIIGTTKARDMLEEGESAQAIVEEWQEDLDNWTKEFRNNYLLYSPYPEGAEKYEAESVLGILPHDLDLYPGEEVTVDLHGFDENGDKLDINRENVHWKAPDDLVEIDNEGNITALDEGQGTLTIEYEDIKTTKPIQVSKNIIEDINVESYEENTEVIVDLNQTINFDIKQEGKEVTVEVPQSEFADDFKEETISVDDDPVLEKVDYELEDDVFSMKIYLLEEDIEVDTPDSSEQMIIDLSH